MLNFVNFKAHYIKCDSLHNTLNVKYKEISKHNYVICRAKICVFNAIKINLNDKLSNRITKTWDIRCKVIGTRKCGYFHKDLKL